MSAYRPTDILTTPLVSRSRIFKSCASGDCATQSGRTEQSHLSPQAQLRSCIGPARRQIRDLCLNGVLDLTASVVVPGATRNRFSPFFCVRFINKCLVMVKSSLATVTLRYAPPCRSDTEPEQTAADVFIPGSSLQLDDARKMQ